MSTEIAYIRYWKRNPASGKTQVSSPTVGKGEFLNASQSAVSDAWGSTGPATTAVTSATSVSSPGGGFPTSFSEEASKIWSSQYAPSTPTPTPTPTPRPTSSPLGLIPIGVSSVPTNTYTFRPPVQYTYPQANVLQRVLYGSTYSANPSGATITASPSAPVPGGAGIWQFLFNPEEIQLESGPEYNRADTWGVADPKNSGQPLAWRNNKNRKLIFSKVILHGYTFGKRVEALEQGLQKLFMARDGENGADGPPVLEFVWGSRVFGPCVIQNIRVREQAWDKGVLVNAEVSFELEQVPEWVINDGYVDIARPGRQPMLNDPLLPSSAFRPGADGAGAPGGDGETPPPPPPATEPGGQPASPSGVSNPTLCNFALKQSAIFQSIFDRAGRLLNIFTEFSSIIDVTIDLNQQRETLIRDFASAKLNFYSASAEIGQYVDSKLRPSSPGCTRALFGITLTDIEKRTDISKNQILIQSTQFIRACAGETKRFIDEWYRTSPKCQEQKVASQCEQYKPGKPCSTSFGATYSGCSSFNNGKAVKCINGVWTSV